MKNQVAVIVGRFQVPEPHAGHCALIEYAQKKHSKILICLGCSPIRLSDKDPMDFATRYQMMHSTFPSAVIVPINDHPSDQTWSENLDQLIMTVFPTDQAVLYCSRDGFKKSYSGRWPVEEIECTDMHISATELREQAAHEVINSVDFRRGVMYACANRFPISYQVIDAALVRPSPDNGWITEVLLCRKDYDKGYRLIGGFVDPADPNLESTVRREINEETHAAADYPVYLGSYRVNDWRYRNSQDKIMTAFFSVTYVHGPVKADDDIVEVKWFPLVDSEEHPFTDNLIEEHKVMGARLMQYDQQRKKGEKS